MTLLFINGCVRGECSRTLALAQHFIRSYREKHPETTVQTADLNALRLYPMFEDTLRCRDAAIGHWDGPMFAPAREFRDADMIVLAAPFWEGTFPSAVHTYLEHICVTGLTFDCTEKGYVGLCHAKKAVFVTTRGGIYESGPSAQDDHAEEYLGSILHMLGIPELHTLAAEGLDIAGADTEAILSSARQKAENLAAAL